MSGSSSDNSPYITPPSGGGNTSCANLIIITNLSSPQPAVVETLVISQILTVGAAGDQGPIQVSTQDGQLAGNIVSRDQVLLLSCIVSGTIYIASVLEINDGEIKLRISAQ